MLGSVQLLTSLAANVPSGFPLKYLFLSITLGKVTTLVTSDIGMKNLLVFHYSSR